MKFARYRLPFNQQGDPSKWLSENYSYNERNFIKVVLSHVRIGACCTVFVISILFELDCLLTDSVLKLSRAIIRFSSLVRKA